MVFYKPKSSPQIGKLMQSNEVITLLGMGELSRRCGWIIYTEQILSQEDQLQRLHRLCAKQIASPGDIAKAVLQV
jgi:hypothetical protein